MLPLQEQSIALLLSIQVSVKISALHLCRNLTPHALDRAWPGGYAARFAKFNYGRAAVEAKTPGK